MKGLTALQRPVIRPWVSKPLPLIPLASAPQSHQLAAAAKAGCHNLAWQLHVPPCQVFKLGLAYVCH